MEKSIREINNKEHWDDFYKVKNPYRNWVGRYRYKIRTELILDFIQKFNNNAINGLEVGCGEGGLTIELANIIKKVDAFDISHSAIDWGKKFYYRENINYFQLDIKDYVNTDKKYNIIVCSEVIYYLSDEVISNLFIEVRKSLSRDGLFILASRVDGDDFNFEKNITLLSEQYEIVNTFTIHAPLNSFHKRIRRICEILSPLLDKPYKCFVKRINPNYAFQVAFICVPKESENFNID